MKTFLKILAPWIVILGLLSACAGSPARQAETGSAAAATAATAATTAASAVPEAAPAAAAAAETGAATAASGSQGAQAQASAPLPVDPQAIVGKLDNGLTYFVRPNPKPEKRAMLRLVVNAGSILENDDQRGLAHFVEHMAFDGTQNFPKMQIVNFLESIGMRFGPELNAFTGYDATVYLLELPTDDPAVLAKGVQILRDWASRISFDPAEVDRERKVIVEEWRLGRGADARMFDRQVPVLFQGSRYAERQPIGKVEVIEKADAAALRRFYQEWYRPELMAVVAVGDFDPARMQELIRADFSDLEDPPGPPVARPEYPVPNHAATLYAPASDPEATVSRVSIYTQHEVEFFRTEGDYRRELVEALYNGMLNARLDELSKKPDSAVTRSYSYSYRSVRTKQAYVLTSRVREGRIPQALETLLQEAERVRRFGFTATELERQKADLTTAVDQAYRERNNQDSGDLAQSFADYYLDQEPVPGVDEEYRLVHEFLPGVTLDEVNALAGELLTDANRVVLVNAPESYRQNIPSEEAVLAMFRDVREASLQPYEDTVAEAPLFPARPAPAAITRRSFIPELGLTEWRLANGVRVLLKPTDFKNDQVLFSAFSPGGDSLASDRDYVSAMTAPTIVDEGGLDGFDAVQLNKKLAGKAVAVTPWVGELFEGLNGQARPADLETMFQLIHLYFTSPRRDEQAYQAYRERLLTAVRNRQDSPDAVFEDRVDEVFSQNHFRRRPWSPALVQEMNLDAALAFYKDRFQDAGDFTFLFVGSFTPEALEPLVASYLGTLPSTGRAESWKDVGIRPPAGVVQDTVRKGLEPKSRVEILFHGSYPWSLENNLQFDALGRVLDIELREAVRDRAGGSYDVGSGAQISHFPTEQFLLYISFGCAPDKVQPLSEIALDQVRKLQAQGPKAEDVAKVREELLRQNQTDVKTNEYWLQDLQLLSMNGADLRAGLQFEQWVNGLSVESLRKLASSALSLDNYVRVVLLPEK